MAAPEIGVDEKADLIHVQEPPGEKARVEVNHLADNMGKRNRVCNMVRACRSLPTDVWSRLRRGSNDNVTVLNVNRRGEMITKFINVYDQHNVQT